MILTGSEIQRERENKRITIEPFSVEQVNPNSYNFRLGATLRRYRNTPLDARTANEFDDLKIGDEGFILEPGVLYLAHTVEVLGSDHYAPTFAARSSVARLGIFINLSASLGDIGFTGQWTLQLYTMNRVRVYQDMNIGQMMWWRPQGTIKLYDGKYQGSVGPRSSDIHVDFHKQIARQRFPGLGSVFDVLDAGPKFANLAALPARYRVPAALCIPAGEFRSALTAGQRAVLTECFSDLQATVGAFFADTVQRLSDLTASLRMPEQTRDLVRWRLTELFGADVPTEFAVRSSGLDEDTGSSSLAGVHHSVLGVSGIDAVIDAVESCWRSHYEAPAVAARIRAGDFDPEPRLAVIVQTLIRPRWAGVAFSGFDGEDSGAALVTVDYVEGLADELVAGVAVPFTASSAELPPVGASERATIEEVVELVAALRELHGHHVDVEWAADADGVHIVQVRPVTAGRATDMTVTGPYLETHELYFDDLPVAFPLGEVAAVYSGYVAKRAPAHRLARAEGVAVGAGRIVAFNGLGLAHPETVAGLFATVDTAVQECVLDIGDTLRQIVVPKPEVPAALARATGATSDSPRVHTAVVRDFIRGELGVITRLAGPGMVVEYTPEGLMALNRGTAGAETLFVHDLAAGFSAPGNVTASPAGAPLLPHLAEAARLTAAMAERYGDVTVEWVHTDGQLYFVDYSVLGQDPGVQTIAGAACMSPGNARGPLLQLNDDELLARLSIGPAVSINKASDVSGHDGLARILARVRESPQRPVVQASRPYAVLSVLIGDVAGFVFDQGSLLGHLAILLREAAVPAVVASGVTGAEAIIADGAITTFGPEGGTA